jgi:hypothetical protein
MNGRLKELAKQSSIWFEDTKDIRTHSISTTTLEKFAESIVRECADIAYRGHIDSGDNILKRFGLE